MNRSARRRDPSRIVHGLSIGLVSASRQSPVVRLSRSNEKGISLVHHGSHVGFTPRFSTCRLRFLCPKSRAQVILAVRACSDVEVSSISPAAETVNHSGRLDARRLAQSPQLDLSLPHDVFLDLARHRHRKVIDESDVFRNLEMSDAVAAKVLHGLLVK